MHDITVLDVLELPIMSNAKLKAGHAGITNTIQYVNILDNRFDDTDTSSTLTNYGENFYLTSMYYGKDDPSYILNVLRHFIDVNASAVCIVEEYLTELPQEAYKLCDEYKLPILFVDRKTPYSIIISSIMELKLSYQKSKQMERLLLELTRPDCSDESIRYTLNQLNPNFEDIVIAVHCSIPVSTRKNPAGIANQLKLISKINEYSSAFASEYRGGVMLVYSFSHIRESSSNLPESSIAEIRALLPDAIIGVSQPHALMELGKALTEASTATKLASMGENRIAYFHRLGPIRLILELQGKAPFDNYYRELFEPLKAYDDKYNSNLLETLTAFVEHNMDYSKTSKAMFVHENTVRYRLSKIKSLIPYGNDDMDFQQTLYLFYKIMRIKEIE